MRIASLALAVTLALTAPVLAQDACLTGASELPDQRAIAALRADLDTDCPCGSFTSPRVFRSCARDTLKSALAGATLRAECKRTAKGIIGGASCGSAKVPCGRFAASAADPLSCKPKLSARCVDTKRAQSEACSDETYCADVVDWTASTCLDVREDGPFVPGFRTITFTKTSATTYCTGGTGTCTATPYGAGCRCSTAGDCQSGVCETQPRALQTSIWYPAPPGSSPIDTGTGGVDNAPLDGSGAPYPILMFSHGSCGYPNQSTFLAERLASYGFVVVAPPHPGNTLSDFPACGSGPNQLASFIERPQDILFVLDAMLAANADSSSPFFGAIDANRIGMSGHSFGGLTVYLVVPLDARFKVALAMAPAVPGMPVLAIPSMNMLGQIDTVVNLPAIRTAYADALPPKFLAEIANAGHYAFSNGCFPSPDCSPPVTLTQPEAHDRVLRYALPFLEVYLAADERFRPFLAPPAGPGYAFQSEL
jgi:dienelactone hydrolase